MPLLEDAIFAQVKSASLAVFNYMYLSYPIAET